VKTQWLNTNNTLSSSQIYQVRTFNERMAFPICPEMRLENDRDEKEERDFSNVTSTVKKTYARNTSR